MNAVYSTKDRILDSAERLFAKSGMDGVSLRAITAEADVNLAAVNYHFQSKEALIRAVIDRRLGPANQKRIHMLDAFELDAGGGPVPLPRVIEAFLAPVLELKRTARDFVPLMGRIYSEQRASIEIIFRDHFGPVVYRFRAAFARTLPQLPAEELMWRMHFLAGAMVHTLGGTFIISTFSNGVCDPEDVDGLLLRMITFFTAAFEAPVPQVQYAR